MKFSVVIPMYNAERTILRALRSIERQTIKDSIAEIIVVDDGSTDGCVEQLKKYIQENNSTTIVLISQRNQGAASARNTGIRAASEDWIALLDADDEWMPRKLEVQRQILLGRQDIDLLGCEINDFPVNLYVRRLTSLTKISLHALLIKMFPQTSTLVFRKSVFDSIGGFEETMSHGEDGRFLMDAAFTFNCYYFPEKLAIYDQGKAGFGTSGLSANIMAMRISEKKNLNYLREKNRISTFVFLLATSYAAMKFFRRRAIHRLRHV
ncbi:glycosyltransferase family 2 protein [Pseudophaeobacter sp. TrK17]|uniref:glycosyltransferase family 2 protein n=1 Tax=Pseudophaeobacter sp. TrK17 TaxID=2815167 RepID=UPI0035CF793C